MTSEGEKGQHRAQLGNELESAPYWHLIGVRVDEIASGYCRLRGKGAKIVSGRGGRIRTDDLLNPIQVRYRAALRPDSTHASTRVPTPARTRSVPPGAAGLQRSEVVREGDDAGACQRHACELAAGQQAEALGQVVVHHARHQVEGEEQ